MSLKQCFPTFFHLLPKIAPDVGPLLPPPPFTHDQKKFSLKGNSKQGNSTTFERTQYWVNFLRSITYVVVKTLVEKKTAHYPNQQPCLLNLCNLLSGWEALSLNCGVLLLVVSELWLAGMWHATDESRDMYMSVNYDWRSVFLFLGTGSLVKG